MFRHTLFGIAIALVLACSGRHSPTDPTPSAFGRLSGVVTIGPNCPVTSTAGDCPTPPGAYAARKVLVFDAARTRQIATVDIDSHGFYYIDLPPATYTIDLQKNGIDRSSDVPAKVTIRDGVVTMLNISIDTGLR